jgi:ketosteroid isomerase-like protein
MTVDPVEILQRGYELIWREGDPEASFSGVTPDFEWVVPDHPEGELHHGADGAVRFFHEWTEPWKDLQVDWEFHRAGPDRVLAVISMHGRGRESGAPVETRFGQVWTFREGRAARMVMYPDVEKAFEAVGLRE